MCKSFLESTADYQGGHEPAEVKALFGDLYSSLLIVRDAPARQIYPVSIRDGVRIDEASGTAADKAKFDLEVLPAGVSFDMELILLVYEETPYGSAASV
jgi:CRISPR/Cas system CSM-associated protein Csm3 (group 7 of RAMP superfamily)